MAQRLTAMELTRVSLVDKGANARSFAVLKRDEEVAMTTLAAAPADATPAGFAAWLRKAADALLGKVPEPVAKVTTFGELVAGQELQDALYDSWYTLQDALWSAIYAHDEAGMDLPIEAKQALVAQNLDEFKAYLLSVMASGIAKYAGGEAESASRHVSAIVAKVGRTSSAARMEQLTTAAEALNGVIAEVGMDEAVNKRADAQEDLMTPEELTAAVAKAVEPVVNRIEAIEKRLPAEPVVIAKAEATGEDDDLTLEGVAKAVLEMRGDLETVLKARGERTSVDGQEAGAGPVKKSVFAGIF